MPQRRSSSNDPGRAWVPFAAKAGWAPDSEQWAAPEGWVPRDGEPGWTGSADEPIEGQFTEVPRVGDGVTGGPGLYRPLGPAVTRRRRPVSRWLVAGTVAVALAVIAGTAIGLRLGGGHHSAVVADPCAARVKLRVTVPPEFKDVMRAATAAALPASDGGCPPVAINVEQPADTLAALKSRHPDVWVPSSTVWLRLAAGAGGFPTVGRSVARTPVVVAIPKPYARKLGWPERQPGWAELAAKTYSREIVRFSMPDPQRSGIGLLSLVGIEAAVGRSTTDPGIAQMRTLTFRSRLADAAADPAALLDKMSMATDPDAALRDIGVFPVTEQALWGHLQQGVGVPLVGVYPPDGMTEADFPLVASKDADADPTRHDLATRLFNWFRTPDGARLLSQQGFRPAREVESDPATGTTFVPTADGLVVKYAAPAKISAEAADLSRLSTQWVQYRQLQFQVLLLVDGSGSMNDPVKLRNGHTITKAELFRQAAAQAVQLFGEETSLGLWEFGTPDQNSPPYVETVPYGPVNGQVNGATRRALLAVALANYKPFPKASTPLFETVLRGAEEMRPRVRPDAVTMVVVLTDGRNQDPRYNVSRDAFLTQLSTKADAKRPLPIFCIGYGGDADMETLTEISKRTGGQAVASSDPGDLALAIAKVFLAAHQVR